MKLANLDGRAILVVGDSGTERGVDVATLSTGRFGPDPASLFARWDEFTRWAATALPGARRSTPSLQG